MIKEGFKLLCFICYIWLTYSVSLKAELVDKLELRLVAINCLIGILWVEVFFSEAKKK